MADRKTTEVEQILARRQNDLSEVEYLVRWRGSHSDTWETFSAIDAPPDNTEMENHNTSKDAAMVSRLRVTPEPTPRSNLAPLGDKKRLVGSRSLRMLPTSPPESTTVIDKTQMVHKRPVPRRKSEPSIRTTKTPLSSDKLRRLKAHSAKKPIHVPAPADTKPVDNHSEQWDSSDDDVLYSLVKPSSPENGSLKRSAPDDKTVENNSGMVDTDSEVSFKHSPRKMFKKNTKTKIVQPVPRSPTSASSLPCPVPPCKIPSGASCFAPLVPVQPVRPALLLSPTPAAYRAMVHSQQTGSRKGSTETGEDIARRMSVRQSESVFRYKDIMVKKCASYTQLWLVTQTRAKNALNPRVFQELCQALHNAKFDDSRVVMLSGSGSVFCSGVDVSYLLSGDKHVTAKAMADAIREFVSMLISFPKPIIAAVNGPAIGIGVCMLPLCDVVYASDKASFTCPYSRLAQTPEACASYTFCQVMGTAKANEMLLGGRKITAIEAYQVGLVSQVFWPTSLMQEVTPRVQHMAAQSSRALESTKMLIRSHQRSRLHMTNESECQLLAERWSTAECQKAIHTYIDDELDLLC